MANTAIRPMRIVFLIAALFAALPGYGQSERQIPPPPPVESADRPAPPAPPTNGQATTGEYGTKFFDELRAIFGRFRDSDLQRVFQSAQPIPCSQLVDDKGEWRAVAFFNDNRKLGDWYRDNLNEVKSDLGVYVFKGICRGDRTSVQLTTKFPVSESLDEYNDKKIRFNDIAINVNAPVSAVFDYPTEAYTFELPYLFKVSEQNGQGIYSLTPPHLADRARYAVDVTNHWDCKNVKADDVTYQFLICRTTMVSRDPVARRQSEDTFGSSAFFILSDGKEATANVRFIFSDPGSDSNTEPPHPSVEPVPGAPASTVPENRGIDKPAEPKPPDARTPPGQAAWKAPDPGARLVSIENDDFRLRFNTQTWVGKIGSAVMLEDQKLTSLASVKPAFGADYCTWRPGSISELDRLLSAEPDEFIEYSVKTNDGFGATPSTIVFDMKTHTGLHVGTLECFFPRATTADSVTVGRWVSMVGGHLILEIPR